MKYHLVKLEKISGDKASIYTVLIESTNKTLFDLFISEHKISLKDEIKDIFKRLKVIGHYTGAREHFFKTKEGNPGDGVCALYDEPDQKLRLYCIRYGTLIVILGNGSIKPKGMRTFQESKALTEANFFLRDLSKIITQRLKDGDIKYSDNSLDFEGNLEFNDEENE